MQEKRYIIFQVNGGIGKNIAAIAVCKAIKKTYPNEYLIVLTGYPEVFQLIPSIVDKVCDYNTRYFDREYVIGKKPRIFRHDPYNSEAYINKEMHLIEAWCDLCKVKYEGEEPEIPINFSQREKTQKMFASDKPILLMHINGGAQSEDQYSFKRDLHESTAQKVADHFIAKGYVVLQIRRDDQILLKNVIPVKSNNLITLAGLISEVDIFLCIDSMGQHTAKAVGKQAVVCWIGNSPNQLGYKSHVNLIANKPTLEENNTGDTFFGQSREGSDVGEFCYNHPDEIFDANKIIEALEKISTADKRKAKNPPKPIAAPTKKIQLKQHYKPHLLKRRNKSKGYVLQSSSLIKPIPH
jgi:ADP-heptose:LPS heptosyltransferase